MLKKLREFENFFISHINARAMALPQQHPQQLPHQHPQQPPHRHPQQGDNRGNPRSKLDVDRCRDSDQIPAAAAAAPAAVAAAAAANSGPCDREIYRDIIRKQFPNENVVPPPTVLIGPPSRGGPVFLISRPAPSAQSFSSHSFTVPGLVGANLGGPFTTKLPELKTHPKSAAVYPNHPAQEKKNDQKSAKIDHQQLPMKIADQQAMKIADQKSARNEDQQAMKIADQKSARSDDQQPMKIADQQAIKTGPGAAPTDGSCKRDVRSEDGRSEDKEEDAGDGGLRPLIGRCHGGHGPAGVSGGSGAAGGADGRPLTPPPQMNHHQSFVKGCADCELPFCRKEVITLLSELQSARSQSDQHKASHDKCQRELDKRSADLSKCLADLDRFRAECAKSAAEVQSSRSAIAELLEKNRILTASLLEEKYRSEEASGHVKTLLVEKIGENLASTQHNLASGFPSVASLADQYVSLMTTGARQDLIDAILELRQHGEIKKQCDSLIQAKPIFVIPSSVTHDFILHLESQIGGMISDIISAVDILFAQFPTSAADVILHIMPIDQFAFKGKYAKQTAKLPQQIPPTGAKNPSKSATEAFTEGNRVCQSFQEAIRANYRQFFSIVRRLDDRKDDGLNGGKEGERSCEAWERLMNLDSWEAMLGGYTELLGPIVKFGVNKSPFAQHLINFLFFCASTSQPDVESWRSKTSRAFELLEDFISQCLEFFWMLHLSVPRLIADTTLAKPPNPNPFLKVHQLLPANLRDKLRCESILFPPILNAADRSLVAHGLAF